MALLERDLPFKEIGESEEYIAYRDRISRVAPIDRPILIIGERGTGKELAAKRLHYMSPRWQKSLVAVNLASLPSSLIESELFGYERGAFTGATQSRKGRFEEAEGGTLFLDEIGLIPLEVQEKILRVVEYGTYERLGSSQTHEANVRIIGATNADLKKLAKEGRFKEDLLDRLSFEVVFIPPLRVRGDDVILLSQYFASRMALECGFERLPELSKDIEKSLREYSWPGNIRELKNVIERAVYRSGDGPIRELEFEPFKNPYEKISEKKEDEGRDVLMSKYSLSEIDKAHEEVDFYFLTRALKEAGGNQKMASMIMGLTYDQFRGLYRKYKDRL